MEEARSSTTASDFRAILMVNRTSLLLLGTPRNSSEHSSDYSSGENGMFCYELQAPELFTSLFLLHGLWSREREIRYPKV